MTDDIDIEGLKRLCDEARATKTINAELVRLLLDYEPDTGILTWKKRTSEMYSEAKYPLNRASLWNNTHAGQPLTYVDKNGYIVTTIFYRFCKGHRLAWLWMTGEWPKDQIDHINGDRADNRWVNLRACTQAENQQNVGLTRRNTSGFMGVTWHPTEKKWQASIRAAGRNDDFRRFK